VCHAYTDGTGETHPECRESKSEDVRTGLIVLSQEELKSRRTEILSILGLSYKEYILKEMYDGLKEKEQEYSAELAAIDFFLKDEDDNQI
jgi:hypothetical protein